MVIPAGRRFEPAGKTGLAQLTAAMMAEASEKSSAEELSSRLDMLGSTVSFSAGLYGTVVSATSLEKNLPPQTLAIMEERLFTPAFDPVDFERVKQQALEGVIYEHQRPSWLAGRQPERFVPWYEL